MFIAVNIKFLRSAWEERGPAPTTRRITMAFPNPVYNDKN
jgi:hypothetical protein